MNYLCRMTRRQCAAHRTCTRICLFCRACSPVGYRRRSRPVDDCLPFAETCRRTAVPKKQRRIRLVPQPWSCYDYRATERIVANFPFPVKEDTWPALRKKLKLSDKKFKRRIGTTKPVFLVAFLAWSCHSESPVFKVNQRENSDNTKPETRPIAL